MLPAWIGLFLLTSELLIPSSRAQLVHPYKPFPNSPYNGFQNGGFGGQQRPYDQLLAQVFAPAAARLPIASERNYNIAPTLVEAPTYANDVAASYAYDDFDKGIAFSQAILRDLTIFNKDNMVISPFSLYVALLMTSLGAVGTTKEQMSNVLRLPKDLRKLEAHFPRLLDELQKLKEADVKIANALFVSNVNLTQEFVENVEKRFRSSITPINLRDRAQAAKTINGWVDANTNHRIQKIVEANDIKNEKGLHILNAVYFKGKWLHAFDKSETGNQMFFHNDGRRKFVPTMYLKENLKVGEIPQYNSKYVVLPYTKDHRLNMVIIVPNAMNGVKLLEAGLENISLKDLIAGPNTNLPEVELFLPRFRIETTITLTNSLWRVGMREMFLTTANFSGISDFPLKIGNVVQKAFIEVNEEGTEAAVVTDVEGIELLMLHPKINVIRVDHPSLFFITYDEAVLFAGRLADPLE